MPDAAPLRPDITAVVGAGRQALCIVLHHVVAGATRGTAGNRNPGCRRALDNVVVADFVGGSAVDIDAGSLKHPFLSQVADPVSLNQRPVTRRLDAKRFELDDAETRADAVHYIVEHIARSLDTEARDRAGIAAGVNHPVAPDDDAVTHHNYSVHLVLRQHIVLDEMPVCRDHGVDADAVVKSEDRAVAHRNVGIPSAKMPMLLVSVPAGALPSLNPLQSIVTLLFCISMA